MLGHLHLFQITRAVVRAGTPFHQRAYGFDHQQVSAPAWLRDAYFEDAAIVAFGLRDVMNRVFAQRFRTFMDMSYIPTSGCRQSVA